MKFTVKIVQSPDGHEGIIAIPKTEGVPPIFVVKDALVDFLESKMKDDGLHQHTWEAFKKSGPSHQVILVDEYFGDLAERLKKQMESTMEYVDKKLNAYMATGNVKGGVSQGTKNDLLSPEAIAERTIEAPMHDDFGKFKPL